MVLGVALSRYEKARAITIGTARNRGKPPAHSRRRTTVFTDEELDQLGAIGEELEHHQAAVVRAQHLPRGGGSARAARQPAAPRAVFRKRPPPRADLNTKPSDSSASRSDGAGCTDAAGAASELPMLNSEGETKSAVAARRHGASG